MKFALKKPCKDCPFHRRGRKVRRRHMDNILNYKGPFPCHKTVEYVSRHRWEDRGKAQACAGRILFESQNGEAAVVALAERLGADISSMEAPADIYEARDQLLAAQV